VCVCAHMYTHINICSYMYTHYSGVPQRRQLHRQSPRFAFIYIHTHAHIHTHMSFTQFYRQYPRFAFIYTHTHAHTHTHMSLLNCQHRLSLPCNTLQHTATHICLYSIASIDCRCPVHLPASKHHHAHNNNMKMTPI